MNVTRWPPSIDRGRVALLAGWRDFVRGPDRVETLHMGVEFGP